LKPAVPPFSPPEATDPVATLRTATHEHHERVDELMDLSRLHERSHYERVLRVLDAFLAGWEPAVFAVLPARWQPWLRARSRRAFLRQDLHHLGVIPAPPAQFGPLRDAAAGWGSVYVMEGSALGGQLIARTLAQAGLDASHGAAYFHGWGDATGAMWREVRHLLASELQAPAALAEACGAARQTFDSLSLLLETFPHERTSTA
jgi:heme oxygenase (biliverdin-IX-beta and delta-forming)